MAIYSYARDFISEAHIDEFATSINVIESSFDEIDNIFNSICNVYESGILNESSMVVLQEAKNGLLSKIVTIGRKIIKFIREIPKKMKEMISKIFSKEKSATEKKVVDKMMNGQDVNIPSDKAESVIKDLESKDFDVKKIDDDGEKVHLSVSSKRRLKNPKFSIQVDTNKGVYKVPPIDDFCDVLTKYYRPLTIGETEISVTKIYFNMLTGGKLPDGLVIKGDLPTAQKIQKRYEDDLAELKDDKSPNVCNFTNMRKDLTDIGFSTDNFKHYTLTEKDFEQYKKDFKVFDLSKSDFMVPNTKTFDNIYEWFNGISDHYEKFLKEFESIVNNENNIDLSDPDKRKAAMAMYNWFAAKTKQVQSCCNCARTFSNIYLESLKYNIEIIKTQYILYNPLSKVGE